MSTDLAPKLSAEDQALRNRALAALRADGWKYSYDQVLRQHKWEDPQSLLMVTIYRPDIADQDGLELNVYYAMGHPEFWVQSVRDAVDVLCGMGILPFHLSSAYSEGHTDGRAALRFDLNSIAELGEHEFGDPDERDVDDALLLARSYWLTRLADSAPEIRDLLYGLLDQDGYVARRQAEDIVRAVTKVLEVHHA